jgi:hypothetical protein
LLRVQARRACPRDLLESCKNSGMTMASRILLVALALSVSPPRATAGVAMIYRVELANGPALLARTSPVPHGNRLVFTRHPDGALVSVKRSDVRRVVSVPLATTAAPAAVRTFRPGTLIMLGPTGEGAGGTTSAASAAKVAASTAPGQAPDGSALLNPARDYRAGWDSSQVPGQNLAYPASPGDYREGMTFAFPPGTAVQTAPGQPPTGVPSGEPPKSPQ